MTRASSEETLPEVAFLDWANEWVGKDCLRCEEPITFVSKGMHDGQSQHRIECDCTVIESTAKPAFDREA